MAALGKAVTSLFGLAIFGFAVFCGWFVINAGLWAWYATAGGVICAGLAAFLGLALTLAPWRGRDSLEEGQQG